MKKITFHVQKIVLTLCFIQLVLSYSIRYTLPAAYLFSGLILFQKRARSYFALVLLNVALLTLRVFTDDFCLQLIQGLVLLASVITVYKIAVHHVEHEFWLFDKKVRTKSSYLVGLKTGFIPARNSNAPVTVFYPTNQKIGSGETQQLQVRTMKAYEKTRKWLPLFLRQMFFCYEEIVQIDAFVDAQIANDILQFQVVLISSGFVEQSTDLDSYALWWASRGRVVVAIHPDYDAKTIHSKLPNQFFQDRMFKRRAEVLAAFDAITSQELWRDLFGTQFAIKGILIVGQSLGAEAVLEAGAKLIHHQQYSLVKNYICIEPWLFSQATEKAFPNLHRHILMIHSDLVTEAPSIKQAQKSSSLMSVIRFLTKNPHHLTNIQIRNLDQGDIEAGLPRSGVYANINAYLFYMFQQGASDQEMVQEVNKQVLKLFKIKAHLI